MFQRLFHVVPSVKKIPEWRCDHATVPRPRLIYKLLMLAVYIQQPRMTLIQERLHFLIPVIFHGQPA